MRKRRLRRRCRNLLRDLEVGYPLDVHDLCRRLGDRRGREIRLIPYPLESPGPLGVCVATETADVIFYQQDTTRPHQDHIILHEVGHILVGHVEVPAADPMRHDSDAGRVRMRTVYDSEEELEAELIATIILERSAMRGVCQGLDSAADPEDPVLERMGEALRNRTCWL
ncbi:hypothetical protein SAMN05444521_0765 [Streptomyces sp. 3214.6]|nr:hypothetical protein SAMN05444521_0765 [Streptomyces sp. 3214.6]